MSVFFGAVGHEFRMSIKRPALWITYGLIIAIYTINLSSMPAHSTTNIVPVDEVWQSAGWIVFNLNLFMPLIAGILASDRMQRDYKLNLRELQRSAPISLSGYILSKYLGVLASVFLPAFVWFMGFGCFLAAIGQAPWSLLGPLCLSLLIVGLPAYAFVVAFSLACPLIMPLRVYQILFTGYWFWGNFLSPDAFPTISDSLLNASGRFSVEGIFHSFPVVDTIPGYSETQAIWNIIVILSCTAAALITLYLYLKKQNHNA